MESYEFFYYAQRAKFTIESSNLVYKIALQKGSIDLSQIIYFRKFEYQDYDHFIIRYKNEAGKIKNLKCFADKGSEGLNPLILRLAEISPSADMSNTSVAEARKLMKTGNAAKGGFIGAVVVVFRNVFKDIGGNMPVMFHSKNKYRTMKTNKN